MAVCVTTGAGIKNIVSLIMFFYCDPKHPSSQFDRLAVQSNGSEPRSISVGVEFFEITIVNFPRLHEIILELGIIASHVGPVGCDARLVKL